MFGEGQSIRGRGKGGGLGIRETVAIITLDLSQNMYGINLRHQ